MVRQDRPGSGSDRRNRHGTDAEEPRRSHGGPAKTRNPQRPGDRDANAQKRDGRPVRRPTNARTDKAGVGSRQSGRRGADGRDRPRGPVLPLRGELIYGRNGVLEALRGRRQLHRLVIAEGIKQDERVRAILQSAAAAAIAIDEVPRLLLDDATSGANHQGVALDAGEFDYISLDDLAGTSGTILALDHLQDPQNFGTLLRAAEAAGVAGVIIPQDRSVAVTPAVVNASAGAVEHLAIARVPNLARALDDLKQRGRWVVGLAGGDDASDLFGTDVPTPAVLVVGAEGSGIGPNVLKRCDLRLSLPMRGRVASLNAATAGAIALFELLRREQDVNSA